METGCQNIQLCVVILKVAFPPQVIGSMFLFPLVYITAQCSEAVLLALGYRCYQSVRQRAQGKCHSCAWVWKTGEQLLLDFWRFASDSGIFLFRWKRVHQRGDQTGSNPWRWPLLKPSWKLIIIFCNFIENVQYYLLKLSTLFIFSIYIVFVQKPF